MSGGGPQTAGRTVTVEELTAQLTTELEIRLVRPAETLLGSKVAAVIADAITEHAPLLAADLARPTNPKRTAAAVLHGLWDDQPAPDWWPTPLGRRVAALASPYLQPGNGSVSHGVAAAMLGVTRGTISQLARRGTLPSTEAGIDQTAVLRRLANTGQMRAD